MGFDMETAARHLAESGVCVAWGIGMLSLTLQHHRKQGKKILAVYLMLFTATLALTFGASFLSQHMKNIVWNMTGDQVADVSYNLGFSLLWMLADIVRMLLSALAIALSALYGFTNDRATKLFTAALIVLAALVLSNYIVPLACLPRLFNNPKADDVGCLAYFLLLLLGFGAALLGYRRFLREKLAEILDTSDGRMGTFVKVPVISCIAFCSFLSFFSVMDITYLSVRFMNQVVFCVLPGMLILVYLWMYWAIFKAVDLATESMKTRAELYVASKIQASVLPCVFPAFPEYRQFDIYAAMEPAKEVGGDFYDFFLLDENHLVLVIADVSGKGVPAALFMMSARTMIKNQSFQERNPAKTLETANEQLAGNNEEGMFVTVFLGILDLAAKELTYSNVGHNPPYLVHADGRVEKVAVRPGFVLGGIKGIRYRNQKIALETNDKLLLYTDGVTEAVNQELELYGEKRLEQSLKHTEKMQPKDWIETVRLSLQEFTKGADQADDITMVALKICD